MDIELATLIQEYLQISIVLVCLFVGYIIKHTVSNEKAHKFIPLIVSIIGVIAAIWTDSAAGLGVTLDTLTTGLASGLASTGLYELFAQLIYKLPAVGQQDYEEELEDEEYVSKGGAHFAD